MLAASSHGPTGTVTCLTVGKTRRIAFSVSAAIFATAWSIDFHALVAQPMRNVRAFNSIDGEYVKAALSTGSVERSFGSCPASTAKIRAQSSAVRAIGPILSSDGARAIAPHRE